ncbi:MAG: sulfatase-like hydrolase/transferase [Planctomycetota bacterium]
MKNSAANTAFGVLTVLLVLLGDGFCGVAKAQDMDRPPNILFIMVDDSGLYDLHAYGLDAVDTPNADRLVSQGVRFTRAYAVSSMCWPARAVVITSDNGGVYKRTHPRSNPNAAKLRLGKGFLCDGGLCVAMIVRWLGLVDPGCVEANRPSPKPAYKRHAIHDAKAVRP